jgi:hypothetical protein
VDEQAAKRVAIEQARAMFMRPSERQAVSALERVINDAKNEGFAYALSLVERELLSADSIDEVLAWLTRVKYTGR